jgi:hypothetical protein
MVSPPEWLPGADQPLPTDEVRAQFVKALEELPGYAADKKYTLVASGAVDRTTGIPTYYVHDGTDIVLGTNGLPKPWSVDLKALQDRARNDAAEAAKAEMDEHRANEAELDRVQKLIDSGEGINPASQADRDALWTLNARKQRIKDRQYPNREPTPVETLPWAG